MLLKILWKVCDVFMTSSKAKLFISQQIFERLQNVWLCNQWDAPESNGFQKTDPKAPAGWSEAEFRSVENCVWCCCVIHDMHVWIMCVSHEDSLTHALRVV